MGQSLPTDALHSKNAEIRNAVTANLLKRLHGTIPNLQCVQKETNYEFPQPMPYYSYGMTTQPLIYYTTFSKSNVPIGVSGEPELDLTEISEGFATRITESVIGTYKSCDDSVFPTSHWRFTYDIKDIFWIRNYPIGASDLAYVHGSICYKLELTCNANL